MTLAPELHFHVILVTHCQEIVIGHVTLTGNGTDRIQHVVSK